MFSVFFLSLVLSLLVLESLGLGLDKRVVVAVVRVEALAVQMNDVGSNCVEKLTVMGNYQNGRRPSLFVINNNYINSINNILTTTTKIMHIFLSYHKVVTTGTALASKNTSSEQLTAKCGRP